ncbi:MAG: ferritin family protein [Armatimonadota bacterium]
MPEFLNPFSGMVHRKMTKSELIRALRLGLSAEQEAVHLYMAHAEATDDELAKKVLTDIANEEREHIGEFLELIKRLAPDEAQYLEHGAEEVAEMAGDSEEGAEAEAAESPESDTTVGSLRES